MPQFVVVKGQDAHVLLEKVFEANSIEHANELAEADKDGDGWVETGDTRYYEDMTILGDETEEYHPEDEPVALTITAAERDTILAGLRALQDLRDMTAGDLPDGLLDIATNGDQHPMLDQDTIDALCERINCG